MDLSDGICLYCGFKFGAIAGIDEDSDNRAPREGDYTVCLECAGVMVFTADGGRRKPTGDEAETINADDRIHGARLVIETKNLMKPHIRRSLNARNN